MERTLLPGDWSEHLCTELDDFCNASTRHNDREVQPCIIGGERCLVVKRVLAHRRPELFACVMQFARDKQLPVREERRIWSLPVGVERRDRIVR